MSFEQATARLERIVADIERPDTELETMIALVEEGLGLIRSSRAMLAEAELKIRKLEEQPTPTAATSTTSEDDGFSLL
ncbi:MAG: exodeoxyribonuclease VII small subunit [Akkermansia sp.]|nr:exodeoxyribonuclease VII small subunit [Akkermansia sp.]